MSRQTPPTTPPRTTPDAAALVRSGVNDPLTPAPPANPTRASASSRAPAGVLDSLRRVLVPPPAWALLPGGVLFLGSYLAPRLTAAIAVFAMLLLASHTIARTVARWIGGPR